MKKKLLKSLAVVAVIVALVGVGVAVVHQGNKYQNQKVAAQQAKDAETAKLRSDLEAEKAKSARYAAAYDRMRLECDKGRGAHDTLSTLSKIRATATPVPVCGPAVLQ